jgi:Ca2+-binding EF-hand superfamily protein
MRWLFPITALLLLPIVSFAEPPKPVPGDEQDLIFIHPSRPYRFRLHLQIEQQSFKNQWDGIMESLFRYLDFDGNGVLDAKELAHAPDAEQFRQLVQGRELEASPPPELKDLTDNPKGGVTLAQLRGYYLRAGVAPWQAEWIARTSATDLFDSELFKQFNPDRADRLTRDQLKNAAKILLKLDVDGDELITLPEILPNNGYQSFMGPAKLNGPFFLLDSSDKGRAVIAEHILRKYGTQKNGKLSPKEIAIPAEMFAALDTNHDGFLDAQELARWPDQPPDLEILVRLDAPPNEGVFLVADAAGKPRPLAGVTHMSRIQAATVKLATDQLEFLRVEGEANGLTPTQRTNLEMFKALDANRDGVLDSKEIFQPPFAFVPYLKLADRNGDNKITEKEFLDFLALQRKLQTRTVTLTIVDRGKTFLDFLDADHDRRISRRELMTLADRIAPWCDPKDGSLDRENIPNQYQIIVSHGVLRAPDGDPGSGNIIRPSSRLRGPLWFRKMDRNADGDVSRAEFLGTEEQFRKLDRNGDGLIDVEEAEAAEKK